MNMNIYDIHCVTAMAVCCSAVSVLPVFWPVFFFLLQVGACLRQTLFLYFSSILCCASAALDWGVTIGWCKHEQTTFSM